MFQHGGMGFHSHLMQGPTQVQGPMSPGRMHMLQPGMHGLPSHPGTMHPGASSQQSPVSSPVKSPAAPKSPSHVQIVTRMKLWGERSGHFQGPALDDFNDLVTLIEPICTSTDHLKDGKRIGEGSFGSIVRATMTCPRKVRACCKMNWCAPTLKYHCSKNLVLARVSEGGS